MINEELINKALRDVIRDALSDDYTVLKGEQDITLGDTPNVTVTYLTEIQNGQTSERLSFDENLNQQYITVYENKSLTFSINFYHACNKDDARKARLKILSSPSRVAFTRCGFSVLNVSVLRNISEKVNGEWEFRFNFDITVNDIDVCTFETDHIENVDIEIEYQNNEVSTTVNITNLEND